MAMAVEARILEPLQLDYSDLLLLSSPSSPTIPQEERRRLESVSSGVMRALGPSGPGLLSISGVPDAPRLRKSLLPLARKLALLENGERARILKEHGLGSDVPLKNPHRSVSSFALQLKFPEIPSLQKSNGIKHDDHSNMVKSKLELYESEIQNDEFEMLGCRFKELGLFMMELGLRLARICDTEIGGHELEESILESCSAKGRLIHYHSDLDNHILKEFTKKKKGAKAMPSSYPPFRYVSAGHHPTAISQCPEAHLQASSQIGKTSVKKYMTSSSNLWQQWHYDYGIFTILTSPMFLSGSLPATDMKGSSLSSDVECSSPDVHTYLQLLDTTMDEVVLVKSEPENFIVQIGESADILSRGKLCSALHAVCKPFHLENISRETFVVFMQPAWDKVLYMPDYLSPHESEGKEITGLNNHQHKETECNIEDLGAQDSHLLKQVILKSVPPLTSRLENGMTFAEFSRQTTRQYYGGSGVQSRR